MLSRLMIEQDDLLLTQLQYKTALKYIMKPARSTLMMKYFVKEWRNPFLFMTRIMNRWWWTRQTWTSKFQDYRIPLWNTRKVPAFDNWFRKSRTARIGTLFNETYNKVNLLIPSAKNQKKWFMKLGTSSYVNYSRRNPKRSARAACLSYWDIGIVYCTSGHFLRKGTAVNRKIVKYTMDLVSIPEYVIKKGRPHGHRYGKKPGDREYFSANQLKKKCKKKFFQGIPDRVIRDETFRNRMIGNGRDEDVCRQWDAFADEDHTHHLTPQEYYHYKSNWWLTSNKTGSNTVPVEHRPDFKQALSTLQQLKQKEEALQTSTNSRRNQQWVQSSSSSSSWWSWQGSCSYESHDGDEPSTDRTVWLVIQVFGTILQGMIFLNSFTLLQMDRLQLTAVYCNRRGV